MSASLSAGEALEMLLGFAMNLLDGKNCTGAKKNKASPSPVVTLSTDGDFNASTDGQSSADDYYASEVDFEEDQHAEEYENDDGYLNDDADGDGVEDTPMEEDDGDFDPMPEDSNMTRMEYNRLKAQADLCFRGHDFQLLVTYVAPAAIIAIFLLSLIVGRDKRKPCGTWKALRFIIAIPMNILNSHTGRIRFTLATVLLAYPSFQLIRGIAIRETFKLAMPAEVKPLFNLAAWLAYGMCLYPIFSAVAIPSAIATVFGFLFAVAVFMLTIVSVLTCDDYVNVGSARITKEIFARFPTLLCSALLIFLFIFDFVKRLRRGHIFGGTPSTWRSPEADAMLAKMSYVRNRCLNKSQVRPSTVQPNVFVKIYNRVFQPVEGFFYPTRLICSLGCCVSVLYYSTYFLVRFSDYLDTMDTFIENIEKKLKAVGDTRSFAEVMKDLVVGKKLTLPCAALAVKNALQLCHYWIEAVRNCYIWSIPFTLIYHLFLLYLILRKYREHALALYKGQYTSVIQCTRMSPPSMAMAFIKFSGFQLAYFVVSLMVTQLLVWVLFAVLGFGVIMPIIFGYTDSLIINMLSKFWPTFLVGFAITFGISTVTSKVFVADTGKLAAIKHRDWFFVWAFFVFMTSTIVGLVGCIMRIIKSIVFTTIFLARLDWSNLPPDFMFLDSAYASYCGQQRFDEYHSHPVVICFADIMGYYQAQARDAATKTEKSVEAECGTELISRTEEKPFRVSKRARTRWFLLFTIYRNPSLTIYRKHRLVKPKVVAAPGLLQKLTACCKKQETQAPVIQEEPKC